MPLIHGKTLRYVWNYIFEVVSNRGKQTVERKGEMWLFS